MALDKWGEKVQHENTRWKRHSLEARTVHKCPQQKKKLMKSWVGSGIYTLRRALSFSRLSESNSTKMTELDCVHLFLGKAWVALSTISQRSPERLHIKVLLLRWRKMLEMGSVILLLSGWFHHHGAHRASPHGDTAGFNVLFILLAAWANSHHCFHCELSSLWSHAQAQGTCAWD